MDTIFTEEDNKGFRFQKTIKNSSGLHIPVEDSFKWYRVNDIDNSLIGFAVIFEKNNEIVADVFINYATEERLNIETDNPMYLTPHFKIIDDNIFIDGFTLSDDEDEITAYTSEVNSKDVDKEFEAL